MSAAFDPLQMLSALQSLKAQNLAQERARQAERRQALQLGVRALESNPDVDLTALLPALGVNAGATELRGLQEIQKGLKRRKKEREATPTAGQENRIAGGLAATQGSPAPLQNLLSGLRSLEASSIPEASQERIVRLGGAEAASAGAEQRQDLRERALDRSELLLRKQLADEPARLREQLASGRTLDGRPLTPFMRSEIQKRLQRLAQGESELIQLPGGGFIATGASAISSAQRQKLEDRLIRSDSLVSDLDEMIALIEEERSRAGGVGGLKRAITGVAGVISEAAEQSNVFGNFAANTAAKIEEDFSRGRASGDLASRADSFLDDAAQGELQALEFFVLYNIADQLKTSGRLTNRDIERAERAFGITKFTGPGRVLSSLRRAQKRAKRTRDLTKERLLRGGSVTIDPQDFESAPSGRTRRRSVESAPDFRVAPGGRIEDVR